MVALEANTHGGRSGKLRLAVVTTHPIQYQVPWLQRLAARDDVELKVFLAMIPDAVEQGRDFGVAFAWDVPLLGGYDYTVLENKARTPSLAEFSGCDTPGIHDELKAGGFDAVVVNGWVAKTCLQALWACRRLGIPCIVRGEANGLRPRPFWKRTAHRLLLAQYSAYLSIGANNRAYYRSLGVPENRIFDTPYCVDNERFARAAAEWRKAPGLADVRSRFGLEPDRTTFVFSGKFVDKKRPADVIEAVRSVEAAHPGRVQALMVGSGPLGDDLAALARGLPVRFAGFLNQSEITAAYAVADCMVLPSDHGETWGLVVNEAMACGLPALVSDQVGCAADLVTPGETGDVFACGDVAQLAHLMSRYGADRPGLARMGEAARSRVENHYTFDRVVDGVLSALRASARRKT